MDLSLSPLGNDSLTPDDKNQALSQGLLGLGAGLLSGSYGHYGALSPALGAGVSGFQQGFQGAIENQLKLKMFKQQQALQAAQIGNYNSEVQQRDATQAEQQRLLRVSQGADAFARGLGPTTQPGIMVPPVVGVSQQPSYGVMRPQDSETESHSDAVAKMGDEMRAAGLIPHAANGDQVTEQTTVSAKAVSPLLDPDYWLRSSEYKRQNGDMKGAIADAEQSKKLRAEEMAMDKADRDTQVEGLPGYTFNPKSGTFKKDGKPIDADTLTAVKKSLLASGATNVSMKVNSYTPASEEAQKEFMKSTRVTYDQLKQGQSVLDNIEKAKALIAKSTSFMGTGGERLLNATKFLNNRLGLHIDTEGVKSAEELRSRVFFGILDNLKKMDSQPSESQQETMRQALGNLETDPSALASVMDAFGDSIRGKVATHNAEVQSAIDRGVKFPYDAKIKLTPKGTAVDPMSPKPAPTMDLKQKPVVVPPKPMKGQVIDGYRFLGGDPANPKSWVKQ